MKRKTIINIHLILASFFIPFLLVMPFSGTLYLLGIKGTEIKQSEFTTQRNQGVEVNKEVVEKILKDKNIDFSFNYIKKSGDLLILRPSTREHYQVKVSDQSLEFLKVSPDFIKKIVELHKGHGPSLFKQLQIISGIGFILITFSGLFLIFGVKTLLNLALIPASIGTLIFLLLLLI